LLLIGNFVWRWRWQWQWQWQWCSRHTQVAIKVIELDESNKDKVFHELEILQYVPLAPTSERARESVRKTATT
jgi:hypothetical protein